MGAARPRLPVGDPGELLDDRTGVAIARAGHDGRLRYEHVDSAFAALLGCAAHDAQGREVVDFLHPDDRQLAHVFAPGPERQLTARHVHADGSFRRLVVRISPLPDDASGEPRYLCRAAPASAAHPLTTPAQREEVGHEIPLDRRAFSELLLRGTDATGVVAIDLDRFRELNARYGSAAGDRALDEAARRLRACFGPGCTLARLGGDEFGILTAGDPETVAARALAALRSDPVHHGDDVIELDATAGICWVDDHRDPLAGASLALARAKELGCDSFVLRGRDLVAPHELEDRWRVPERVRHALDHDGFVVCEQPIVRLDDRTPVRSELLLRLPDDDGSLITPDRFLPYAERSGVIREIDRWVVARALGLLAARGGKARLNVNLSGVSLVDPVTVGAILAMLRSTPADPAALTFEITETAAMRELDRAAHLAGRLGALGCGFAIDDFGTGWSSFHYLQRFPITELKIDGMFVTGLCDSQRDRTTVRAMTDIAREYRLETVAEKVEDGATAELLHDLGVDNGQGYHFGRPEPARG